ncbi:hypothetical protein HF325_002263 [Metschnikowia pulcherrima]|uniref:Mitochondrial fission 1 protein n=1 Tax=Metschnikowia pulcherrima TaxID=27326 RepID=A0A8H7GTD5_9ASCO|nr:hypothetical protein HF325_002263 [Metschnikowia pulcherrima]
MFKRSYPALEELNVTIAPEQLRILKNQLDSEHPPSPQLLFNYAWGLLKTDALRSQKEALEILATLYRDAPSLRREALYYLALGSVKTGEFTNARRYADSLLEKEPDNAQFKALKQAIDDQVTQDGLIGLGIAGGVLAVGLGVLGAVMRKKR